MSGQRVLTSGSTGIGVPVEADGSHLAVAAEFEGLGYDTLWLAGGQLQSLERVTEMVHATTSARIATGIVPLGVFDVDAIVEHRAPLARTDPGRYVLGLGGPQQARSLAALNGYLDELDAAGVGKQDRLLAALGPRKLEIAAERTAGAITLMTEPGSTAAARRRLGADPLLVVQVMTVLETDADRARAAVRETMSFLLRVGGYRAEAHRQGFDDDEIDALSDRLVDAVVAWGDVDAIAHRVAEHRAAGADHVAVSIFPAEGGASLRETAAAVAARLDLASWDGLGAGAAACDVPGDAGRAEAGADDARGDHRMFGAHPGDALA